MQDAETIASLRAALDAARQGERAAREDARAAREGEQAAREEARVAREEARVAREEAPAKMQRKNSEDPQATGFGFGAAGGFGGAAASPNTQQQFGATVCSAMQ